MVAHGDNITMLQGMLFNQLAIDVSPVRAAQVFEKLVIQDVDNQRVVATHRGIIDAYIVIGQSPNRVTFLGHVEFGHYLTPKA